MTSLPVPAGGTQVTLPAFGGFSGDFIAPNNTAEAGTVIVLTSYSTQPRSAPLPLVFRHRAARIAILPAVVLSGSKANFWVSVGTNIAFDFEAFPAMTFNLATGTTTNNVTFYLETINGTTGTLLDQEQASSVSGLVVNFPGDAGTFSLAPGYTYWWELISATPTPSPSPSPSPSA
jgi:hypothetical protein